MPSYIYVLCPSHYFSLSLHDALPISDRCQAGIVKTTHRLFIDGFYVMQGFHRFMNSGHCVTSIFLAHFALISTKSPLSISSRSEEHTSELQSLRHLVCRLLLDKKKQY